MIDFDRFWRALVLGALGAAAMALLLPSLAAMRYTDAHDWYAARKVSVAEALIFVGFDERASTKYRLADGRTVTWLREGVATYPAARESRSLILAVIGDNAALGACAGFVAIFALSGLLNLARHEPAGVSRVSAQRSRSPAAGRRPGFIEDDALPAYHAQRSATPTSVAPSPESGRAAPTGAPQGGSRPNVAVPSPGPPAEAEPEGAYAPAARPRGRWF